MIRKIVLGIGFSVSCIPLVLSYNHPELTAKTVNSILNHSDFKLMGADFPLVLVHNGSEPKHKEFLLKSFPSVDHVVIETNRGYSGGANFGISYIINKYSNLTPWILFITNDCELIEWPKLKVDQEKGLLVPWIWSRKSDRIDSIGGKVNLTKGIPSHLRNTDEFKMLVNTPLRNQLPYIPGSAFLIHQDIFIQLNGFDESLGTYWEDIDLSIRAYKGGINLGDIKTFQVRHKIGKTCHKDSHYTTYLYQRNRKWVSRKYVEGLGSRIKLEWSLWTSWLKLSFKLLKSSRYADIKKLAKGILE